MFLLERYEVIS